MFFSTCIAMIVTELTGVITVLIDGIVSSRFLSIEAYSGISLLKPFSGIVLTVSAFLSTGCNIVCSRLVGSGRRKEANGAFNLALLLSLLSAGILIFACLLFPKAVLGLCGVSLTKYPEFDPHLFSYLHGYLIGVPALILSHVMSPILIMDNGKRAFTVSSFLLCIADVAGDILNAFVFHGGAFGMGAATSFSYIVQLLFLIPYFLGRKRYFRFSFRDIDLKAVTGVVKNGSPALTKRLAVTFRDSAINYMNISAALSSAAIAARGIQNDMFSFFFCVATGLGRAMVTLTGVVFAAGDRKGLKDLFSYALKFGIVMTSVVSALVFAFTPSLTSIYTDDPEILSLAVFSIRWMAAALVFDTVVALIQYYLQGIGDMKRANILSFSERFVVPVSCAFVLGLLYGSRGILASVAVCKIVLLALAFLVLCIDLRRVPKKWEDLMFLPEGFGGKEADNLYGRICSVDDAVSFSDRSGRFCLERGIDRKKAMLIALCVEEMAVNVLQHAEKIKKDDVAIDFRLYVSDDRISFTMSDLGDLFDPTVFYRMHQNDSPEEHIGIRMLMKGADEVRYFSSFGSNNLIVIASR